MYKSKTIKYSLLSFDINVITLSNRDVSNEQ